MLFEEIPKPWAPMQARACGECYYPRGPENAWKEPQEYPSADCAEDAVMHRPDTVEQRVIFPTLPFVRISPGQLQKVSFPRSATERSMHECTLQNHQAKKVHASG